MYIGKPLPRDEDHRFLTGRGRYVGDLPAPGLAHVVFVRSPHGHARILGIESAAARAMPGVLSVFTAKEWREQGLAMALPLVMEVPFSDGRPMNEAPRPVFAEDRARHVGDPVAAASIAQVHKATLRDGSGDVAVKILRPRIERAFQRDIDAFYLAASLIRLLSPASRRLRPRAVIAHFEDVVVRELDLRMEASAIDEFANATKEDKGVEVPAVRWPLSAKRVVTVDWAEGTNLGDVDALRNAGHDLAELAARLIQMFLRQALRDGYFHADMHQGNFKVSDDGVVIALDFGIMGRIDAYTRRVYAEILMGFIKRDYHAVAAVHFEAGYVPRTQNVDDFAQALRSVGEPIFGMDASHISMARLLAHLFEVTERFGMRTRTELILLQRTMVVVEGVARSLDPSLNMWETARPIVEDYIKEHIGPRAVLHDLATAARVLARLGPKLPDLAENALLRLDADSEIEKPRRSFAVAAFLLGVACAIAAATLIGLA